MDYAMFVKDHTDLVGKLCQVLLDAEMEAEEGELCLLWLAGLSLGMRQASMTQDDTPLAMLAVGWQIGASVEEDDL